MRRRFPIPSAFVLPLACLSLVAAPALAAEPSCEATGQVGRVVAVGGAVHVEAPGEDPRSLTCNDVVNACETIVTSPGARVGLLTRDVVAHVDADSRVRLAERDGAPDLYLASGAVRIVDTRASGSPPFRLETPHVSTTGAGSDTEVFVGIDDMRARTRVCNHDESVTLVGPDGAVLETAAGACALAADGRVDASDGAAPSIDIAAEPPCAVELGDLGLLLGPDVAQGPPIGLPGFPSVAAAEPFRRSSCDNPGSGCAGSPTPPPAAPPRAGPPPPNRRPDVIAVDPDPGTGCGFPGFPCP